jgi:ATP-binding protein involved in chromosome partitioning
MTEATGTGQPHAEELGEAIRRSLANVIDPEIRRPVTELDMIGDISVADGHASVDLKLTIVGCPAATAIERDVREHTLHVSGVATVDVIVSVMTPEERTALTDKLRGSRSARTPQFGPESLTRIFAISSGKGGVGKSTITANLGAELARRGLKVGIVDADVYGFSIPGLLGLVDETGSAIRPTRVGEMILPPIGLDVKVISIGMFVDINDPASRGAVSWRGPMLHRTISQFLSDVFFGDLDILLLDLPPGTGDVAISLGQLLPNAEVIVVTTPQPAAADIAERSGIVARQTGQKVFGVIENMGPMVTADGSVLDLFGSGGGAEVARRLSAGMDNEVPLLASIPLSPELREGGDSGLPIVISDPANQASVAISTVADAIASRGRGLAGRKLGLSLR